MIEKNFRCVLICSDLSCRWEHCGVRSPATRHGPRLAL